MSRRLRREPNADQNPWTVPPRDGWLTDDATDILVGAAAMVIVALIALVL